MNRKYNLTDSFVIIIFFFVVNVVTVKVFYFNTFNTNNRLCCEGK